MPASDLSPSTTKTADIVSAIRQTVQGRNNATGTFTITPNATSTVVQAPNCANTSFVFLSPQTFNAANDMATTWTIAANGQFTVNHASNPRVDRTFGFVCLG